MKILTFYFSKLFRSIFQITLLIIVLAISVSIAQVSEIKFDHLSVKDGLSQSVVNCIYRDKKGLMWFGTQDGLNRYDGYNFKVYKSVPFDSNSLSDNWIQCITEDTSNNLWIGTYSGGIFKFNTEHETFTNYRNDPGDNNSLVNNRVWAILALKDGNIVVGTSGGLDLFNEKTGKFKHYKNVKNNLNSLSNNAVNAISEEDGGILWLGTWGGGLDQFDKKKQKFKHYFFGNAGSPGNAHNFIKSIYKDKNTLWLGTRNGLIKFEKKTGSFEIIKLSGITTDYPDQNSILSLTKGSRGQLWIGTHNNGLYIYDPSTGKSKNYLQTSFNPGGVSDNWISALYNDPYDVLWCGTGKGIDKLLPLTRYFMHVSNDAKKLLGLNTAEINAVTEDHNGIIWIGTWDNGLYRFDRKASTIKQYIHNPANLFSLPNNIVWSILEDKENNLWVGTYAGIKIFDQKLQKFKNPPFYSGLLKNHNISELYQDSRDYIWIGTWGGGLYCFDTQNKKLTGYQYNQADSSSISNNLITSIYEDSKNNLWIGTNAGGLNRFIYSRQKFIRYQYNKKDINSISNNNVTTIHEHKDHSLWIGTWGGGINKFLPQSNRFSNYTESEGLSNNVIYGILEDQHGILWLSTGNGLSRLDPKTGKFIIYNVKDGLDNAQFRRGFTKCRDGLMIFGGINGLTLFYPDSIKVDNNKPPLVITSFEVFNTNNPKNIVIPPSGKVFLKYFDHDFAIGFSLLDFNRSDKNNYSYMLEGYDDKWSFIGNRRKAYYTNLSPGSYTFKVKASNGDNIWNPKETQLKIIIIPPFWKTWWFFVSLAILFLLLLYLIYRYRLGQLLKFERMRSTIAIDLHDDIGAGLTRISLFSDTALRNLEKLNTSVLEDENIISLNKMKSLLVEIGENSRNLISSMSDIVWMVNPRNDSFENITLRMKDYTTKFMELNDIDYEVEFDNTLSSISLPMDMRRNLFLIYKEAISNIIRHANATQVKIRIYKEKNFINILIHDNGAGLPAEGRSKGNGLINIKKRANSYGGNSVITSIPGKGTSLDVTLKIP